MQFVESRHRGQIIDVDTKNLVAQLCKNRVVKLEKKKAVHPRPYLPRLKDFW